MRRGMMLSILLTMVFTGAVIADEATTNWQALILEDFDNPDNGWTVTGSKFVALADDGDYQYPLEYKWIPDVWPEALGRPDSDTPGVLGVQASFNRRGYNYLEFIPPEPIAIPGRPATLDLWAWGSNYDYYLEFQIRDYRGVVHTVKLGDLGYGGWKNLEARIPNYIPRQVRHVSQRQSMELVKIVLWTRPEEAVDGFHFYLDQIKVLTDTFDTPFDGEGLADPEFIQETWNTEQGQ